MHKKRKNMNTINSEEENTNSTIESLKMKEKI